MTSPAMQVGDFQAAVREAQNRRWLSMGGLRGSCDFDIMHA